MADKIKTDETLPDVPARVVEEAKMQGIKDVIGEDAGARFKATDGVGVTEDTSGRITPTYDVFHLQDFVDLDPKALKAALEGKDRSMGFTPSQGQVAGLLEVERSGKNRTDVVKVLCDYLGIDSPYEVTDAGPNYTNNVDRVTPVKARG